MGVSQNKNLGNGDKRLEDSHNRRLWNHLLIQYWIVEKSLFAQLKLSRV